MSEVKRGRKPITLDKQEFQGVVSALEAMNNFSNRTQLWQAVEDSQWAKTREPRPLTAQVAMMKAEELGLEIKTVKGKRGRSKGQGPVASAGRRKKVFSLEVLTQGVPVEERAGLAKTLAKAASGSLKARVKLNCLNCVNYQKGEVASCEIKTCPMWDVRPYKRVAKVPEKETKIALEVLSF